MLSYRNFRAEFEREVLNIIIKKTRSFTFNDIYKELRKLCDNSIPDDYIVDIVCVSIEFCLSQGYIKHYTDNVYTVSIINRDKFETFTDKLYDKDFTVKNTF